MSRLSNQRDGSDDRKNARHCAGVQNLLLAGNPCCNIAARKGEENSVRGTPNAESKFGILPRVDSGNQEEKNGGNAEHKVSHENRKDAFHGCISGIDRSQFLPARGASAVRQT
jgi:hypothetical protein